jgi:hypothetical protein
LSIAKRSFLLQSFSFAGKTRVTYGIGVSNRQATISILDERRKADDLSWAGLAQKIGVSAKSLDNYRFRPEQPQRPSTLRRIHEFAGVRGQVETALSPDELRDLRAMLAVWRRYQATKRQQPTPPATQVQPMIVDAPGEGHTFAVSPQSQSQSPRRKVTNRASEK